MESTSKRFLRVSRRKDGARALATWQVRSLAIAAAAVSCTAVLWTSSWSQDAGEVRREAEEGTQIIFAAPVPPDTEGPAAVVEGAPVRAATKPSPKPRKRKARKAGRRRIDIKNAADPLG